MPTLLSSKGLAWRLQTIRSRVVTALCRRAYLDTRKDPEASLMLAGTARSGTTWLAEILATRLVARILFEPFHPRQVEQLKEFHYFHYLRPSDTNVVLTRFAQDLFSGRIRHPWIDRSVDRILPRFRVIKEIRANLFLKWLHLKFPRIPLVFMLRHPCAVVLSRMQLGWATDSDIAPFLIQRELIEDHLGDLIDVIGRARTPEEKHAVIWCVTNLVPLRQFAGEDLAVVFYEDLCIHPDEAVPAVFRAVRQPSQAWEGTTSSKPSSTSRSSSAVVQGGDTISSWTRELTRDQIRNILRIVERFGLSYLYGSSPMPLSARDLGLGLTTVADLRGEVLPR